MSTIHERIRELIDTSANGRNSNFASKIGVSEANIRSYLKGVVPKADTLEKIVSSYDVNADWLLTGRGSMLNTDKPAVSNDPLIGKPYFNVDFEGGFTELVNSQTRVPATSIVVQGFEKADLWCNVTGHSMEPKINHGDIIALHKCTLDDVQYGEIYAVVLDTIRTIKILRRASTPDNLLFVPINTDYDPQEYPKTRIQHIFEVIGSISKFF